MIKYEKCMYCGSDKIEKGYVNARIPINGPEEKWQLKNKLRNEYRTIKVSSQN